jgi:hypothetical protein
VGVLEVEWISVRPRFEMGPGAMVNASDWEVASSRERSRRRLARREVVNDKWRDHSGMAERRGAAEPGNAPHGPLAVGARDAEGEGGPRGPWGDGGVEQGATRSKRALAAGLSQPYPRADERALARSSGGSFPIPASKPCLP